MGFDDADLAAALGDPGHDVGAGELPGALAADHRDRPEGRAGKAAYERGVVHGDLERVVEQDGVRQVRAPQVDVVQRGAHDARPAQARPRRVDIVE
ncbi:hypothetical protein NEH16_05720 [Streptomyces drozdowiczii]|uniref:Uncharacterized protein n=1 Tax=Streptomyces drozdowiczii TaxID=202862 RepID=A0ABY6PND1_9ACTN|nr:hypothetical protein [Streptomyces drozdowiczii]UZK53713.1 hypothetical protein NEH16_05720 [Streptomyces drozdowiczii]